MSFVVVIPSRFGSTRLPGKPLLDIAGKPMVRRVWEQACASEASEVIVATDDQRILECCDGFGARVCMTSPDHVSGTDRLQEVASVMGFGDEQIVVNVQGDEPLIPPAVINQVAANLAQHPQAGIATLCEPIAELEELQNPNVVKVVMAKNGHALYFSRAPVPWPRDAMTQAAPAMPGDHQWWRHIGIYAYRSRFLQSFVEWTPAPVEQIEQLEQLRAMYQGVPIHVAEAEQPVPAGVDTESDYRAVCANFDGR